MRFSNPTAAVAAVTGLATALLSNAPVVSAAPSIPSSGTSMVQRLDNGTSGCGKSHSFGGITQYFSLESGGRTRKYSVHMHSDYDENTPHPLVFGFHGTSSIGFFFEADTKLSEERFSGDKIMVYPDGIDGAWAGGNYSTLSVPEDLTFISDLLDALRSEYCLDDSRIYATGISNGGGFVNAIACSTLSSEFAAFAPHSGSYYDMVENPEGNGCTPARSPMPILEVHGGNDQSVYYDGGAGSGGMLPSVPEWLGRWADRNACEGDGVTEDSFDGDVHHTTWTCGDEGSSSLQHWKVDDMGHCWASTEINFSQISVGEGPTHIDASTIIMEFFDHYTKP